MKKLLAVFLLCLPPSAAGAWFFRTLQDPLKEHKSLYEASRYVEVIAQLSPSAMQKLPGRDLKLAYFYLGSSYERTGRLDKALGVYQLGVRLFPGDVRLLAELATLLHKTNLEEEAQPLYQKVLKLEPHNARAHKGLAEIDRSLGFLDRSAEHYEEALEQLGDQAALWRDYAEVLLDQRDTKTAELAVRRALALAPEADSWIDLAFIQRAQGHLEEALQSLDKAAAAAPARPGIALARALWLLEAGRPAQALAAADAILKSSPADPLARLTRGAALLGLGRAAEAAVDLKAAALAERQAPFTARVAAALLERLKEGR